MTQREKRDLIRSLKKEIKAQQTIILESIECKTMTPAEVAKIYEQMRSDIDCNDLDVFIHQNEDGEIIVNFDIR